MSTVHNTTDSNSIEEKIQQKWIADLKEYGILYLYGIFGYGKTTQAIRFAKSKFKNWEYISVNDIDFLEKTDAFLSSFKKAQGRTLLILDDLQWLNAKNDQEDFFSILLKQAQYNKQLQILLLSRGNLPNYLIPLRITKRLFVLDSGILLLDEEQITALFANKEELASIPPSRLDSYVSSCYKTTHGYWMWIQVYLQRLCEYPNDAKTASFLAIKDIYYQLDHVLFASWPAPELHALITLSIYPVFTLPMAKEILGENAATFIDNILSFDSFVFIDSPTKYRFKPAIIPYLRDKIE